ncbi:unnamed protein product, partial [marine sediment metagenome]
ATLTPLSESGTKGELGELESTSALYSKTGNKSSKKRYGYTAEPNSPNSLLGTAQARKPNSPFSLQ